MPAATITATKENDVPDSIQIQVTTKPCATCGTRTFTATPDHGERLLNSRLRLTAEQVPDGEWVVFTRKRFGTVYTRRKTDPAELGFHGHWETCAKTQGPMEFVSATVSGPRTIAGP